MTTAYLYLNTALYLLFAVWCTFAPASTAMSIGYQQLSSGGRSEYLVIYGGLQLGIAALFWLFASNPHYHRLGISASVALYLPVVIYRVVTVVKNWPVPGITLATGALELALLIGAMALRYQEKSPQPFG